MRVLILAEDDFWARERSMLSRLEVGLADEGVRVVQAVPGRAARSEIPAESELYSQVVRYEDWGRWLGGAWRGRRVVAALTAAAALDEDGSLDVVHVFGRSLWPLAGEVARLTGAALAVEVWSASQPPLTPRLIGGGRDAPHVVCLAADASLERAVRAAGGPTARVVPWGVHTPAVPGHILSTGRAASIMIVLGGVDEGRAAPSSTAAVIEALGQAAGMINEFMIFADADPRDGASLLPVVERADLSGRFTLMPDMDARRELVLCGDVLVVPAAVGEHRSLLLDAMGHGMAVAAAADPWNGSLITGQTAVVVDKPNAERWSASLSAMLTNADATRALGRAAHAYVRQHHKASSQVAATLDAYEWITTREAIPFKSPGTA